MKSSKPPQPPGADHPNRSSQASTYRAAQAAITLDRRKEAREWIHLAQQDPDTNRNMRSDPAILPYLPDDAYE